LTVPRCWGGEPDSEEDPEKGRLGEKCSAGKKKKGPVFEVAASKVGGGTAERRSHESCGKKSCGEKKLKKVRVCQRLEVSQG